MRKLVYILLVFVLHQSAFYGQVNLVPNSGFEIASPCPNYPGQINYATGWNNVNMVYNSFSVGSPDFFHACGTSSAGYSAQPPATFAGTCNPHTGNGFSALVLYDSPYPNYREYMSTQLTCPMVTGNTYTVSFWLTNGTGPKSPYIIKNIGAHLSTTPLSQTGFNIINVVPQCEITGYSGTNAWVQYTFVITATASWQYITLGAFRTDALNSPMSVYSVPAGPPAVYANYFFDDISVIGSSSIGSTISTQSVTCNSTNNGSATITPTSAGTYTYNWMPGNFNTPTINNLSAGIYTVTISNSCGSDTKTVSIAQQPTPTISINSATVCSGTNVNITANTSGGTPGYTYQWSQGVSTSSVVNINAVSSAISCTVTDSQGCKANNSTFLTINNSAPASFSYSLNVCKGILTTTNTSPGTNTNAWYFGDGSTSTQTSPSYTYSLPGTYNISLITNPGGCQDSTAYTITVSNPTQSIYSFTNTACDSVVQLNNTSIGATTYEWNFGDGNTSALANPGSHHYLSSGVYTITLITNPGSQCADTLKQAVVISLIKASSQFNAGNMPCTMSVTTVNTSSLATNYAWDFGDGFTSTLNNPTHNYSSSGNYTVTLIANPGTSCADTTYQPVTISGAPVPVFSYIKDPCSANVTFTNNSINSTSFEWNFGNYTSNLANPIFNFNHPGTYTVSLTVEPGFPCATTVTQVIVVNYTTVTADFTYNNPQYTTDIEFINHSSSNAITFEWSFGDGFGASDFEPVHTYEQVGDYTACLQVTNIQGCSDVICKNIKVDADWTFYIPDAFSPNADGINDLFFAKATNISKFHIMIFDRWGEKIFSSDDITIGWDGKYKGKLVQEDVYVWKVNFTDMYSKSHDKTGHVTIIK